MVLYFEGVQNAYIYIYSMSTFMAYYFDETNSTKIRTNNTIYKYLIGNDVNCQTCLTNIIMLYCS